MEKSAGVTEATGSSGVREHLGICFTIDYLLFNKGSSSSRVGPEAQSHMSETGPHSVKEERRQGTLFGMDSMELESRGEGAEGSEEENEEERGKGTGEHPPGQAKPVLHCSHIHGDPGLLLCGIYQWIMDHYLYFKVQDKNWRNSVHRNLSLNECFDKAGRSDNGKGHVWAIHPANLQELPPAPLRPPKDSQGGGTAPLPDPSSLPPYPLPPE